MLEIVIAALVGFVSAGLTRYADKYLDHKWWISWIPELRRRRWVLILIAAAIGAVSGVIAKLVASILTSQLPLQLGSAFAVSVLTILLFNVDPAKLGGLYSATPLKLFGTLFDSYRKEAIKAVKAAIGLTVQSEFPAISELDRLVTLCSNLHQAGLGDYPKGGLAQLYCTNELRNISTDAAGGVDDRTQGLRKGQSLLIRIIIELKISRQQIVADVPKASATT